MTTNNNNALSDGLFKNGIDFLNFSVKNLNEKRYKYSIIFFAMAIEVLLKAILTKKHFLYILADKKLLKIDENNKIKIDENKIKNGGFKSIEASNLESQFKEINSNLPHDLKILFKAFDKISKERNKAIHFFSSSLDNSNELNKLNELNEILNEQWKCWHALQHFLSHQKDFEKYKKSLDKINQSIKNNPEYTKMLDHKYTVIKPQLEGKDIKECKSCKYQKNTVFLTQVSHTYTDNIVFDTMSNKCLMCDDYEFIAVEDIIIKCTKCSFNNHFNSLDDTNCENCEEDIDISNIDDLISGSEHSRFKDSEVVKSPDNCCNCDGYETVIYLYEQSKYFCKSCLNLNSEYITCESCGQVHHEDEFTSLHRNPGPEDEDGNEEWQGEIDTANYGCPDDDCNGGIMST